MPEAARTLVKSPPELWAEVSDPAALARHLGAFGDIRITGLEPESTVAWEGTRARGTVGLEPAGWGTKVTVTAEEVEEQDAPAASGEDHPSASPRTTATAAKPDPAPRPVHPEQATEPRGDAGSDVAFPTRSTPPTPRGGVRGLFARLRRRREEVAVEREPASPAPDPTTDTPRAEPEPQPLPIADQPTIELPAAHVVPEVEPAVEDRRAPAEILDDMLASLGSARHRPFSRD